MPTAFVEQYLNKGFSLVPVSGKFPTDGWQEYQNRKLTLPELKGLFTEKHTGLAVITGLISGVLALDIDTHKGGLTAIEGKDLPLTWTARSASGGYHYYFRYDTTLEPLSTTKTNVLPGVDVRGKGGLCVLPPSRGASGTPYVWLSGREPWSCPLASIPTWLMELLQGKKQGGTYSGPRHPEFVRVACGYFRQGLPSDQVRERMKEWNENTNSQPFDSERFEKEFVGIKRYWDEGKYQTADTKRYFEAQTVQQPSELDDMNVEDFLSAGDKEIQWVVPGLIPASSLTFISGIGETRKTWLLMDLAIEAARGGSWLGLHSSAKPARVMYIDQERHHVETRRRFSKVLAGKSIDGKSLKSQLRIMSGTTIRIDLEHSYQAFKKKLEAFRPELVLIDSFVTFHSKEENHRSDIQPVFERLKTLRNEFGCAFVFLDHESKIVLNPLVKKEEPNAHHTHGSTAKVAAAESFLTVRLGEGPFSVVYHTKNTCGEKVPPFQVWVENVGENAVVVRGA